MSGSEATDNQTRLQCETPDIHINRLKIDEVVSTRPQNCRDIRFGFGEKISASVPIANANLDQIDQSSQNSHLQFDEVIESKSWKEKAVQVHKFSNRTVQRFAKILDEEGVRRDSDLCLKCIDALATLRHNAEAARDGNNKSLPEQLRAIIREQRLRQANNQ